MSSSSNAIIHKAKKRNISLPTLFEAYSSAIENNEWQKSNFDASIAEDELPLTGKQISSIKLCSSKASKEFSLSIISSMDKSSCPATESNLNSSLEERERYTNRGKYYDRQANKLEDHSQFYSTLNGRALLKKRLDDKMLGVHQWVQSQASIQYQIKQFDHESENILPEIASSSVTDTLRSISSDDDGEKSANDEDNVQNNTFNTDISKTSRTKKNLSANAGKAKDGTHHFPGLQKQDKTAIRGLIYSHSSGNTGQISVGDIREMKPMPPKNVQVGMRRNTIKCGRIATPAPKSYSSVYDCPLSKKHDNLQGRKRGNEDRSPFGSHSAFSWPSFDSEIGDLGSKHSSISRLLTRGDLKRSLCTDL